jgi:hypothetical protein
LMPLASKGICTVRKKMEEEEELTITVNWGPTMRQNLEILF